MVDQRGPVYVVRTEHLLLNKLLPPIIMLDTLGVTLTTLIASACLEIRSFRVYYKLDSRSRKEFRDDYLLLGTWYVVWQ